MTALANAVRLPPGELLLADCGHPHWPFWRLVLALVLLTQIVAAMSGQTPLRSFRSPRVGTAPVVRVVRTREG